MKSTVTLYYFTIHNTEYAPKNTDLVNSPEEEEEEGSTSCSEPLLGRRGVGFILMSLWY